MFAKGAPHCYLLCTLACVAFVLRFPILYISWLCPDPIVIITIPVLLPSLIL